MLLRDLLHGAGRHSAPVRPTQQDPRQLEAVERLRYFDLSSWGSHRYAPEGEQPPRPPASAGADRVTAWLEALQSSDTAGAELAPILLSGLAAGYGTTDLDNRERRLTVHHLSLIVGRYRRFRAASMETLPVPLPSGLELPPPEHSPSTAPRRRLPNAPHSVTAGTVPHAGKPARDPADSRDPALALRALISRCWAVYRTYLHLRETAEALTGAPEDESFQGIRRPDATPREQQKAHL